MLTLLQSDTFESLRPSWQVSPLAHTLVTAALRRHLNWTLLSEGLVWDFSLFGTLLLCRRPCFEHEVERALDKVCLLGVRFLYFSSDEDGDDDDALFLAAGERETKSLSERF